MMVKMGRRRYTTVSIPTEFMERIDKIIADAKYGYKSRAEFVNEAIRRRLEELKPLR